MHFYVVQAKLISASKRSIPPSVVSAEGKQLEICDRH